MVARGPATTQTRPFSQGLFTLSRELSKDSVLLEGVNCILPFGRRKVLYVRDAIELGREQASFDPVPN